MTPTTTAAGLRLLADWLDQADALIDAEFAAKGQPHQRGDDVQRDLRKWAAWLDAHPAVDAEMAEDAWPNGDRAWK